MTDTEASALRKALEAKSFHGKKPKTAKKAPKQVESYAEKIARLHENYEVETEEDDDSD